MVENGEDREPPNWLQFDEVNFQFKGDIPRGMSKVMSRGINKTATSARAEIARRIGREVNIKQGSIKNKITKSKASYSRWQAMLGISSKRISLISFKTTKQTKKGVTYRIDIGGARKLVPSAFIGTPRRTGVKGVLKRMTPRRSPLAWLRGPSLGQVFEGAGGIAKEVVEATGKKLEKNIDAQIKHILNKSK